MCSSGWFIEKLGSNLRIFTMNWNSKQKQDADIEFDVKASQEKILHSNRFFCPVHFATKIFDHSLDLPN